MLRSVGKRDIGQCEVSRLLFSEPLYSSTFSYVSQNLELSTRQLNFDKNSSSLVKKNLLDFYADRDTDEFLKVHLSLNLYSSFIFSANLFFNSSLKSKKLLLVLSLLLKFK